MVYRIYVEKRPGLTVEADALKNDISAVGGLKSVTGVRFLNRYDAENITPELFEYAKTTVFSEPQVDLTYDSLKVGEGDTVFAVEYLPGQYDQRADSASQCIQIISQGNRPLIRTAKIYVLSGNVSEDELERIKKYVINPVEAREASLDTKETLESVYDVPADVAVLDGFNVHRKIRSCDGQRRPPFHTQLFQKRRTRSDNDRDQDDRHILVRPLPSHHIPHNYRQR